jgi:polyphosphate kinase 2 (PPK2 family)
MLENLDLDQSLSEGEYKEELHRLRPRLLRLQRACWNAGLGSLIVFEGWAFSGRGKAIRTLTQRLEPRGYVVNHVRAPRSHEAGLPWMWRFWESLPRYGQMEIYDGAWYRRIFVSRSQGLVSADECEQAVEDINSFEKMLVDDHYVMAKFFFHIDLHEQSKRMAAAREDPLETWKLESDDWEERVLDPQHLEFAEDMLKRTTEGAVPWNLVAANDTLWSRIEVIKRVTDVLSKGLEAHGESVPA